MSESCWVCPLCKIQFPGIPSDSNLVIHLTQFHDYQQCELCDDQVFVESDKVEEHVAKRHQREESAKDVESERKRKLDDGSSQPLKVRKPADINESGFIEDPHPLAVRHLKSDQLEDFSEGKSVDINFRITDLTRGVYSRPSKYDKDPLANFWYAAICECLVCTVRPSRKFSSHNAWLQHIKYSHNMSKSEYRQKFGNPDITGYKHNCYICYKSLSFNPSIIRKHLQLVHRMDLEKYSRRFRNLLLEEKKIRPLIPSSRVLEGWWEGCMYSCKHCTYTVPGQASLEHHLTLVHKFAPSAVKDVNGDICTLIRFHQCYICQRIVKHDYRSLYHHLQVHKMDFDNYTNKFMDKIKTELSDKGMDYIIEKDEEIKNSPSLEDYLSRRKTEEGSESFESRLMKDWFDYCEYRCSLCQEVSFSHLKFHLHIVRQHKLPNIKEYRSKYGEPDTIHRLHKCFLCSIKVKWEASRIRDHLRNAHKITGKNSLKEYGEKFKDLILCELRRLESEPKSAETLPARFGQSYIGGTKKEFNNQEWKSLTERKHPRNEKISCPECRITINRSSFTRHLQRAHPFHQLNEQRELRAGEGRGVDADQEKEDEMRESKDADGLAEESTQGEQPDVSFEEPVLEEVVLEAPEDASPRYLIDHESGEIIVLEENSEQSHQKDTVMENQDISLLICGDSVKGGKSSEESVPEDPQSFQVVESEDPDCELETGPLNGRIVEVTSPSYSTSEDTYQFVGLHTSDTEEAVKYQQVIVSEDDNLISSTEHIYVKTATKDVDFPVAHSSQTDDDISSQTLFISKEKAEEYPWDGTVSKQDERTRQEKHEPNILATDKGLESIILSNVEGVQQIAIVRKKSSEQFRFDKKTLLEHLTNILKDDQKILNDNSSPLKIIEIEVDHRTEPAVKSDSGKVSRIAHSYAIKSISDPMNVFPNKFSVGTQVSRWTKLANERQKIARHKCVRPRSYRQVGSYDLSTRISNPVAIEEYMSDRCHYSSKGTQVTHDVNRGLVNEEEDEEIRDRIIAYVQAGHILERTCPGCNKVLSKPKNLITHLQTQHYVRLAGSLGEALDAKQQKDNEVTSCSVCSTRLSRKSLRRHMRIKHNQ